MVHHQGKLIAKRAAKRTAAKTAKSVAAVAKHFSVSERSVHTWLSGGCPRPSPGNHYDLEAIADWRAKHLQPRPEARKSAEAKTLDYWRVRTERARALTAEEDLRKQQGELVETEWVARLLARHVATHNALFEQLSDRVLSLLPSAISPEDRRRVSDGVTKVVHDLRQQMSESIEEWEQEVNDRKNGEIRDEAEEGDEDTSS